MIAFLAATCLLGSGLFTAPVTGCTPGAYARLSRAEVCTSKDRPSLPAAERRKILTRYRLTSWSGQDGELDHLQPFFLGGRTDASNVWPQRGPIPNPKDRLEDYVRRRICVRHTMSVRYARRIFAGNWIAYYRFYHLGAR